MGVAVECVLCHEFKPLSEFYFHAKSNTFFSKCKACCIRLAKKRNREKRPEIRKQRREYRNTEHGRRTVSAAHKRGRQRHPDRARAREAVHDLLPSASERRCYYCDKQAVAWHHHKGYDRQHRLDVIPLCHKCHVKADALQRSQKSALPSE